MKRLLALLPPSANRAVRKQCISISHKARNLSQRFRHPDVVLIGEYHGANVGDMAMGQALRKECALAGKSSLFQTLHNLDRWPKFENTMSIVGGGTVLTAPQIDRLKKRFARDPQQLSILGVNYISKEDVKRDATFLGSIRHLSLRSKSQAEYVQTLLKTGNVSYQPDLAFGLFDPNRTRSTDQSGVMGCNWLPLYATWNGSRWAASDSFAGSQSEHWIKEQLAYESTIQAMMSRWSPACKQVIHVPFAVEDWHYAESFLGPDTEVKQMAYSSDPFSVIDEISKLQIIVSSRFHSLVLALVAQTPVVPLPYSSKCIDLLHDLGWTQFDDLQPRISMESFEATTMCVANVKPILLTTDVLSRLRDEAMSPVRAILNEH